MRGWSTRHSDAVASGRAVAPGVRRKRRHRRVEVIVVEVPRLARLDLVAAPDALELAGLDVRAQRSATAPVLVSVLVRLGRHGVSSACARRS